MILCIGPTPAAQRVMTFGKLTLDEVNRARHTADGIAGKSVNVAKVLAELGAEPFAVGFAGGERGRELLKGLSTRGIKQEFVWVASPTRQCISILDESSRWVTELVEESHAVEAKDYDSLTAVIDKGLAGCDAVVMSGSLTPGGPVDFYKAITAKARERGILSILDAQGPPLMRALSAGPDVVKPNRQELAATVGQKLESETGVIEAMREVQRRGAQRVVVTSGKGPILALDAGQLWRVESPAVEAVNPIGSGDAFTAGLVWKLTCKETLGEACRWAAAAGAANALSAMPGELKKSAVEELVKKVEVKKL